MCARERKLSALVRSNSKKIKITLKVDGNEKWGGGGEVIIIQALSDIVAIEDYLQSERVVSL